MFHVAMNTFFVFAKTFIYYDYDYYDYEPKHKLRKTDWGWPYNQPDDRGFTNK